MAKCYRLPNFREGSLPPQQWQDWLDSTMRDVRAVETRLRTRATGGNWADPRVQATSDNANNVFSADPLNDANHADEEESDASSMMEKRGPGRSLHLRQHHGLHLCHGLHHRRAQLRGFRGDVRREKTVARMLLEMPGPKDVRVPKARLAECYGK